MSKILKKQKLYFYLKKWILWVVSDKKKINIRIEVCNWVKTDMRVRKIVEPGGRKLGVFAIKVFH